MIKKLFRAKLNRSTDGQVILLFALFSLVLVGIMALAVDAGYLMTERRKAQNAADAAAMAGGIALLGGDGNGVITATASDYAAANGVDTAGGSASIAVAVSGTRKDGEVAVDVQLPVQRFFLGAVYTGPWEVSAHAVARIRDIRDGQYALIALEEPGIEVNGTIAVNVVGGSIMSNDDVLGASSSGSGSSIILANGTIDASGIIVPAPGWNATDGMWEHRPPYDDPLAGLAPPPTGSLTTITAADLPDCFGQDCTLQPGYYENLGKIRISDTATLLSGTYVFSGTSLNLQNSNSRIEGNGVLLYFDGPAGNTYFDPKTGAVVLTAPASSPYAGGQDGMLLWIANCTQFDSQGNEEFYLEGIFYAPCSDVTLHGNPFGDTIDGTVIVGNLDVRGTSDMIIRYHSYFDTPRIEIYLVE